MTAGPFRPEKRVIANQPVKPMLTTVPDNASEVRGLHCSETKDLKST